MLGSNQVVNMRYITDYPKCNFSCVYCIAGHGEVTQGRQRHWDATRYKSIINNIGKLPFKLNVRLGVAGEFFLDKSLIQGAEDLSHCENVASVNLITNLSFKFSQYKKIFAPFDESKIALVASYHPGQIKDPLKWIETAENMSKDYDFAVVLVAFPPMLKQINSIYKELKAKNLQVFTQPFIGKWDGKDYPDDYKDEEENLLRTMMYSRHDYEFLLKLKKPGLCNAGYKSIFVNPFGEVFPCGMGKYEKSIGNLAETAAVELNTKPLPCSFSKCQCDTENINTVKFEQYYTRDSLNQHSYIYNFENEAKTNKLLDEWQISY